MLIAIEGINGSGKGTQAEMLQETLEKTAKVELVSFPRYGCNFFAGLIADYLNGKLGDKEHVHPKLAAMLYAGDRAQYRALLMRSQQLPSTPVSRYVICDRYFYSNVAFQAALLPQDEWEDFLAWCVKLEQEFYALPRADVTILFRITAASADTLIAKKKPRAYTPNAADIHERDLVYQARCGEVYDWIASHDPTVRVVDVERDGEIRECESIATDVLACLHLR